MPTTDPVRRRKQNCENQKKFRERQNKLLEGLKATLEQQQSRIGELEKEKERLQSLNVNANADISRLRDINHALRFKHSTVGRVVKEEGETFDNESFMQSSARFMHTPQPTVNSPITMTELPGQYGFSSNEFIQDGTPAYDGSGLVENDGTPEAFEQSTSTGMQLVTPVVDDGSQYENQQRMNDNDRWLFSQHCQPLIADGSTSGEGYLQSWNYNNTFETGQSTNQPGSQDLNMSNFHAINGYFNVPKNLHWFPIQNCLSKHISTVSVTLQNELMLSARQSPELCKKVVRDALVWVLRSCWPTSEFCFKMMSIWHHCYKYELWRHFPCQQTYYSLHPMYRPTVLQMTVPHNPTIDWLPWPSVRDKLILLQDRIDVDGVCAYALEHTLLEPLPKSLRKGVQGGMEMSDATFHMWDLYLLEKAAGTFQKDSELLHKPQSQSLKALSDAYGLDVQNISLLRLNTPFFERYPDFILPQLQTKCKALPLNVAVNEAIGFPRDLTEDSAASLRTLIRADVSAHTQKSQPATE